MGDEKIYYTYTKKNRPQASAGTVNKFIDEQVQKKDLKENFTRRGYKRINDGLWLSTTHRLRKGKVTQWGDRLLNPPKLDVSKLNLKGLASV